MTLKQKNFERKMFSRLSLAMIFLMLIAPMFLDISKEAIDLFKVAIPTLMLLVTANYATSPKGNNESN